MNTGTGTREDKQNCILSFLMNSKSVSCFLTSLEYFHSFHVGADLNQVSNRELKFFNIKNNLCYNYW